MTLVRLTALCSVNPDRVESVFIQPHSYETGPEAVVVSMQNGDKFRIGASSEKNINKTLDEVVFKLSHGTERT